MHTPDSDTTTCSDCCARILWTITAAGRRLAVDADIDTTGRGNTAVYADVTGRLRSRQLTRERPTLEHAEHRHMPHIATCTTPRPRPRRAPTSRHRIGVRPVRWQRR